MAATYPYISGPGNISLMVNHLRKSFPQIVNSETVKKLGIAPNNESSVISVLQFVNVLDKEGKQTAAGITAFSKHNQADFENEFRELVATAYKSLFDLHGEGMWRLESDDLITFFRTTDKTGAAIGQRQAGTFKTLANLSGFGDLVTLKSLPAKANGNAIKSKTVQKKTALPEPLKSHSNNFTSSVAPLSSNNFGLTVRIEINLPADGSKETYDNIFKSIKENLLNG